MSCPAHLFILAVVIRSCCFHLALTEERGSFLRSRKVLVEQSEPGGDCTSFKPKSARNVVFAECLIGLFFFFSEFKYFHLQNPSRIPWSLN